jgi:hypothetical protein
VVGVHCGDGIGIGVIAEFGEDFVGVFAEQGGPGDHGVKPENLIGLPNVR